MYATNFSGERIGTHRRREQRGQCDHRGKQCRLEPLQSNAEETLDANAAGGEEHRISGREIVMFSVHDNELGERDQISDGDDAVAAAVARDE